MPHPKIPTRWDSPEVADTYIKTNLTRGILYDHYRTHQQPPKFKVHSRAPAVELTEYQYWLFKYPLTHINIPPKDKLYKLKFPQWQPFP